MSPLWWLLAAWLAAIVGLCAVWHGAALAARDAELDIPDWADPDHNLYVPTEWSKQ